MIPTEKYIEIHLKPLCAGSVQLICKEICHHSCATQTETVRRMVDGENGRQLKFHVVSFLMTSMSMSNIE